MRAVNNIGRQDQHCFDNRKVHGSGSTVYVAIVRPIGEAVGADVVSRRGVNKRAIRRQVQHTMRNVIYQVGGNRSRTGIGVEIVGQDPTACDREGAVDDGLIAVVLRNRTGIDEGGDLRLAEHISVDANVIQHAGPGRTAVLRTTSQEQSLRVFYRSSHGGPDPAGRLQLGIEVDLYILA